MGKSIKIILLMFSCLLFTSCFSFPENDVLMTGNVLACNENTVALGTCSDFSSSGYITVFEKHNQIWENVFTYKVPSLFRGPVTLQMNENYIVAGLDVMRGFSGIVLVFIKKNGKWKKGYYIKSPHPVKDDLFGYTVSLDNNKLLVGSKRYGEVGNAFLFSLGKKGYSKEHIFENEDVNSYNYGGFVLITNDSYIISDPLYLNKYNNQFSDNYIYEKDEKGKEILKKFYNENKQSEGALYFYDKNSFNLKNTVYNKNIQQPFLYGHLGINGLRHKNIIIISDFCSLYLVDEQNIKLKKIWNKDELTYFSPIGGNDNSCRNYAYSDGILIIGDSIYKFENYLKKLNTINLICNPDENNKPFGVYSFYKDLLICTDDNCDNYAKRKEQEINGHKRGYSHPFVEKTINQGRVHIMRIAPDGSYTEEAIIARRTNKDGKIEFYDMLHDDK